VTEEDESAVVEVMSGECSADGIHLMDAVSLGWVALHPDDNTDRLVSTASGAQDIDERLRPRNLQSDASGWPIPGILNDTTETAKQGR
jgi:hypothetical protein